MSVAPASRPIVLVSGLGPVSRLGFGVEELKENLARQVSSAATGAPATAEPGPGLIPDFRLSEFIETLSSYRNPLARAALAAGAIALEDAYVLEDEMDPARSGMALATALGDPESEPLYVHSAATGEVQMALPGRPERERMGLAGALAAELSLAGFQWNMCGDLLAGARALEAAWTALEGGRADLMLAGGADAPGLPAMQALQAGASPAVPFAQGAAVLVLETQEALERREGYAFAELGSILCRSTEGRRSPGALAELLRRTVEEAIARAGIWQGDVGAVFVCSGGAFSQAAADAERLALAMFSQVPTGSAKAFAGETFAAGFPMECVLAAEALHSGELPPRVVQVGKRQGVEFWMRREGEGLLGFAALVVGCTADLAAAAVLKSL